MARHYTFGLIFFLAISFDSFASETKEIEKFKQEIINKYEPLLTGDVNLNLVQNHEKFLQLPNNYWEFLDRTFLNNWDFATTTRALLGRRIYSRIPESQFEKLSRSLEVTLVRYAFESLSLYGGQEFNLIDVELSQTRGLAWMKINIDSPRLPDVDLDLLLKRTINGNWRGVDFRFKGITYVNLKKNSYRQDFKNLKVQGLLKKLEYKNKIFFKDLCQGEANYLDPKMQPCL